MRKLLHWDVTYASGKTVRYPGPVLPKINRNGRIVHVKGVK